MTSTLLIAPTANTQDYILPAAVSSMAQTILIKNTSLTGLDLIVKTSGFDLIDGRITRLTLPDNASITFFSDGKTWWSISTGIYDPVTDPLRVGVNG